MYLPKCFSESDGKKVRDLIQRNSFAVLMSFPNRPYPFINHLPLIFSSVVGEEDILIGHMAKMNPQWKHFKDNPRGFVIFNGEHTYITPRWYTSSREVPTWNYAVAHVYGDVELVEDFDGQIQILKQLTKYFESKNEDPWAFELPDDLKDKNALTQAIVCFKIKISNIDAKFKLSQNRSPEDRAGVIKGLSERSDEMSKAIKNLMNE